MMRNEFVPRTPNPTPKTENIRPHSQYWKINTHQSGGGGHMIPDTEADPPF